MAKGKVSGEVAWHIEGHGFKLIETLKGFDGEDRKNYVTVWTDARPTVGSEVEVTGDVSVRLESYTGKDNQPRQNAAMHFNNVTIKEADAPF
jgi:hypothetical protein